MNALTADTRRTRSFSADDEGRVTRRVGRAWLHGLAVAALAPHAAAQCELATMAATDFGSQAGVSHYDRMGSSVDISGPAVLVGAFGANTSAGASSGVVWAYRHDGDAFVPEEKIRASDADWDALFGFRLALDGDMAVIWGQDQYYTFLYNGNNGKWVEQPEKLAGIEFDGEIALDGDVLVVASPWFEDVGHVRIYRWDGSAWQHEQTIDNPEPVDYPAYGTGIDLDGEVLVVGGSRLTPVPGEPHGAVWTYRHDGSTWQQEHKLTASTSNDHSYGANVAVDGDVLAVAAVGADVGGLSGVGVVYLYERIGTTWGNEQMVEPDLLVQSYGRSITLEDDVLVVGAPVHNLALPFAGVLYVYHRDAGVWTLDHELIPAAVGHSDSLGASVAIDAGVVVGGADCRKISGFDCAGGAYVFAVNSRADVRGAGLAGFGGLVPSFSISDSLCAGETVTFSLTDSRPFATTTLVLGLSAVDAPFKGGTLVPMPQVLIPGLALNGAGSLVFGLTWPDDFPPGVPLLWQYVVADPDGPFGFALSNGVETTSGGI